MPRKKSTRRKSPKRKSPRRRSRRKSSRMEDNLAIIGLPSVDDSQGMRYIAQRAVDPIQLARIQNMNFTNAPTATYSAEQLLALQGRLPETATKEQRDRRYLEAKVKQIKGIADPFELIFIEKFEKADLVKEIKVEIYEIDGYNVFSFGDNEIEIEKIEDDRKMSNLF